MIYRLSEIEPAAIQRINVGIKSFDDIYGISSNGDSGMPRGKISIWSAQAGAGKTRLAIFIAKQLSQQGKTVLFFQSETTKHEFAQWVKDPIQCQNIYVSEANSISEQMKEIVFLEPDLVIIDSINTMQEFNRGSAKEIEFIIMGDKCQTGLKQAINGSKTHIVLICQVNKDMSPKGSSTLPHLVDAEFLIEKMPKGVVKFSPGKKNRYGATDDSMFSLWVHGDEEIRPKEYFDNLFTNEEIELIKNLDPSKSPSGNGRKTETNTPDKIFEAIANPEWLSKKDIFSFFKRRNR